MKTTEAATLRGQFRRSKYGAIRTTVDGIVFASKAEARRYGELRLMEKAGQISNLELQPRLSISIKGIHICNVLFDFLYFTGGPGTWQDHYEDVKGRDNALSRLKRKLVEAQYGIKVKLIRYGHG